MGNFYDNYVLGGVTQQAVAAALAGRNCIVTPAVKNSVVVFDERSEQNQEELTSLAKKLSEKLQCPVLAILNHDDDILWYQLCVRGQDADTYDSMPGYFDGDAEPSGPAGGDAGKLCAAFGSSNMAEVERILRATFDDGQYAFAVHRHADLVNALGISELGVGVSYASFDAGELPEGLSEDDVVRTA